MTPRELFTFADAHNQKIEFEQEQRRQEIYTSALLISRFVWCKGKIPPYEKTFGIKKKSVMSDADMLRQAESLNAMFGGIDTRKAVV